MKPKLLSLAPIADAAAKARIEAVYDVTVQSLTTAADVAAAIPGYEAVIVPFTSQTLVDEAVLAAGKDLKLIASTYGGTRQNIADIQAIEKGITVIHTGASRERPMAEYTLGLVLASLLRIASYHADMTLGGEAWPRLKYSRTRILNKRSVAVVGYGRIGKAIVDLFRCFTDKLAVVSKHMTTGEASAAGLVKLELNEAFAKNEIIILAGGSNAETFHMVGAEQFAAMQDGALFVNIARGKMVDQAAMIAAAQSRNIFLALDVFENEPLEADSPLRTLSNALITPHRANNSIEFEERWDCLAGQIEAFARGETPESALTLERARVMSES
ncbi:MAG: hypothetical protein IJJ26_13760 [Victivallales bacterium]|nr:hypothetical protein [Victivallales bacterium]